MCDTGGVNQEKNTSLREMKYVLQHIVIRTNIDYKQLVLVFFLEILVALLQNTTRVTTATTMATASGNAPLAPHMCPKRRA